MQQSKKLNKELEKENIASTLTIVEDGTHGFGTTDKAYLEKLSDEMVDFIVAHKNSSGNLFKRILKLTTKAIYKRIIRY